MGKDFETTIITKDTDIALLDNMLNSGIKKIPLQVTKTYDYDAINNKMVLNGFFIYGDGEPLRHFELKNGEII